MQIRKSTWEDFPAIQRIYAYARLQMQQNGNPTQWGSTRPTEETVKADIANGNSYVLVEQQHICGVFVLVLGDEPTYQVIEQGSWLNDAPYGTIHRIASDGSVHGVLKAALHFCMLQCSNLRIDTHQNNLIMQHLLHQLGFQICGTIYVADGSPRIAYQKILQPESPHS